MSSGIGTGIEITSVSIEAVMYIGSTTRAILIPCRGRKLIGLSSGISKGTLPIEDVYSTHKVEVLRRVFKG